MSEENQFLAQPHLLSPIINQPLTPPKVKVFFTYQSPPRSLIRQNLTVIKQQLEEKRRMKIFEPRRKLSFQSSSYSKRRQSRLPIFQQRKKPVPTIKSHIFLKDSAISGAQTIVDQLQQYQQVSSGLNPIKRKLSQIKMRQGKKSFHSNTVTNSIILNSQKQQKPKPNRIQSDVLSYHFSPNHKNKSSVTIKASSKDNHLYAMSKFSHGLSVLTNDNHLLSEFHDKEEMETPKYHKSTYRSARKAFQPEPVSDAIATKKQLQKKNNPPQLPRSHTDRFYDETAETPRLTVVTKRIGYQLIDPLTSALKRQKLQRKQQRKLSEIPEAKKASHNNKIKTFFYAILAMITQIVSSALTNVRKGQERCVNFLKSDVFLLAVIVLLSLVIFGIQLVQ